MKRSSSFAILLALASSACGGGPSPTDGGADADEMDTSMPSVCVPVSEVDAPDTAGIDANCDGVDGLVADSIFVDSTAGSDANAGTRIAPAASIGRGIELALAQGKHDVLVAQGEYVEQVTLVGGISLHGGYSRSEWRRGALGTNPTTTVTAEESPVLIAANIATATRVTGFRFTAPTGTGGASSIAMRVVDSSSFVLEDSVVRARAGSDGTDGQTPNVLATPGNPSGVSAGIAPKRATMYSQWGSAGSDARTPAPCGCGAGGVGWGILFGQPLHFGGNEHAMYLNAANQCVAASGTQPGASTGSSGQVGHGLNGLDGATGEDGTTGSGGSHAGEFAESGYAPRDGTSGGLGEPGGGGGGGAAAQSVQCAATQERLIGGTGGYGGSGGCGGQGGPGGTGGGGSIAMYVWRSTPLLLRVTLQADAGGDGGDGALGVLGGEGGAGGSGGGLPNAVVSCSEDANKTSFRGGSGGRGGNGGRGGQGGGGAGGASVAVLLGTDSSLAEGSANVYMMVAASAPGGAGGNVGAAGLTCNVFRLSDALCSQTAP